MKLYINNETSELECVVLGIGTNRGKPRSINPMIRKHLAEGTFPTEEDICAEIQTFENVLKQNGVEVLRPIDLQGKEQIFTRDIGFVIEDKFFVSNMKHAVRSEEQEGIQYILDKIEDTQIINIPKEILVEGGDVLVWNDHIFIGISDRTTANSVDFIQSIFPKKTVLGFEITVDQNSPDKNILHLDCTFQPIGTDEAIIYHNGFVKPPKVLLEMFPKEKLIEVDLDEKNQMFPNIFSISPKKIAVEKHFTRLITELKNRGYEVFEVDYRETSKLSGLLRCSTLPLRRKKS